MVAWAAAGGAPWPNGAPGAGEHLRDVFYRQGFNDREIVALSGAHTIGRAFPHRSGFGAPLRPWLAPPTHPQSFPSYEFCSI